MNSFIDGSAFCLGAPKRVPSDSEKHLRVYTVIPCNHIEQLTSNVSKRIGIIRRIKYYLPSSTLNLLGNALVMPLFDYCSSVWSNCNVQYSNSLQILHNRLARILLSADSRTSVNDLMTKLSWNKLEQRWNDQLLITTFKCLQGNAPSYLSSNFLFSDSAHSKGTRS